MRDTLPYIIISTHTLTWSVTLHSMEQRHSKVISTHTLTWSVTGCFKEVDTAEDDFNSHAHVERDVGR